MANPDRLIADLNWCVTSPGVFCLNATEVIWPNDEWFATQPVCHGEVLPVPRHPHHFRLGLQFEALIHHWIEHHPTYQTLTNNLQVFDDIRTVGEFDLIVRVSETRIEHWELAVKFFICGGDSETMSHWYGPNTSDRLDLKFNRMLDHQLALSHDPAGKETLEKLGFTPDAVRGFVKGRLFYPFQSFMDGTTLAPAAVNPAHEKGWWVKVDDVDQLEYERIALLQKEHWLAPITTNDVPNPMTREELNCLLEETSLEDATLFALLDSAGKETSRGFILQPDWFKKLAPKD